MERLANRGSSRNCSPTWSLSGSMDYWDAIKALQSAVACELRKRSAIYLNQPYLTARRTHRTHGASLPIKCDLRRHPIAFVRIRGLSRTMTSTNTLRVVRVRCIRGQVGILVSMPPAEFWTRLALEESAVTPQRGWATANARTARDATTSGVLTHITILGRKSPLR